MKLFASGQKVRTARGKILTVKEQIGPRVWVVEQGGFYHADNLLAWKERK